jgi:hypothetical protein
LIVKDKEYITESLAKKLKDKVKATHIEVR